MQDLPFNARCQCDPVENGLDLILSGLEYLVEDPSPRRRKHAIINLHAGVGALLRARLAEEHWSLVFHNPAEADHSVYEEGAFQPVGLSDCLGRLERVCGLAISPRWHWGVNALDRRRDELEARGQVEATAVLAAVAVTAVGPFVETVCQDGLSQPLAHLLARVRTRVAALQGYIDASLQRIAARHPEGQLLGCPNCRQEATLIIDDGPICLFCGYSGKAEHLAEEYAESFFAGEDRWLYRCPACGREVLLDVGPSDGEPVYRCFACGRQWDVDALAFCDWCNHPFESAPDDPEQDLCELCRGEGE